MDTYENEFLWSQKYRPKRIADCILEDGLKATFQKIVDSKNMQSMLFTGSAGVGKTTVARALANELEADFLVINASEENGIEVLRTKIKQYASTVSLMGGLKIILLDEADYITPSAQAALRGIMEEFSANCRFILTCNFKNKIIEAVHSRCAVIEFASSKAILAKLAGQFMRRLRQILEIENVAYDKKVVADIIMKYAPDWRRVLNECQKASMAGSSITTEAILTLSDTSVSRLIGYLRDKDFKSMRIWIVENSDIEPTALFRRIYDGLSENADPQSIPQAVLIIADYSYKVGFVADREICVCAAMVELMANITWK